MRYLIMECFDSYAIALDKEGRFLKVANLNYEVGQEVNHIFAMKEPESEEYSRRQHTGEKPLETGKKRSRLTLGFFRSFAAVAAVILLFISSLFILDNRKMGSLTMSINPEVQIDINKKEQVKAIKAMNPDGEILIKDYQFNKKHFELVMDELIDLAFKKGFLMEEDQVRIRVDGNNPEWVDQTKQKIDQHLRILEKDINIVIKIESDDSAYDEGTRNESDYDNSSYGQQSGTQIVIPIEKTTEPAKTPGHQPTTTTRGPAQTTNKNDRSSDYDATNYDEPDSDYDDSDYDSNTDYEQDSPYVAPTSVPSLRPTVDDSPYDDSLYDQDSLYDADSMYDSDSLYD